MPMSRSTGRVFPSGHRGASVRAARYERRDLHAEREGLRDGLTVVESVLANPLLSRRTHYTIRHDGERIVEEESALTAIRAVDCP